MDDLKARAREFAHDNGLSIERHLGGGQDGQVWRARSTAGQWVIKVVEFKRTGYFALDAFDAEVACYQRLAEHKVHDILGFAVPRLLKYDENLRIIAMGLVSPPFVVDSGKAYVGRLPPYDHALVVELVEDQFEPHQRGQIHSILDTLWEYYGIYYADPKPANIAFPETEFPK